MVIVLHGIEASPPVRAVLFTLNALGLEFKFKKVNMIQGENVKEPFLKMNPTRTVPVLEDDGHYIVDSHAIAAYLVRKYGKDDSLYPKEFKQRAIVDQRLHFDSGVLYVSLRNITLPLFKGTATSIPEYKIDAVNEGYGLLEAILTDKYVTGENLTIADFSIFTTVSSLEVLSKVDVEKYPKIAAWMELMLRLPYYERANEMGLALFNKMINGLLNRENA